MLYLMFSFVICDVIFDIIRYFSYYCYYYVWNVWINISRVYSVKQLAWQSPLKLLSYS